MVLVTPETWMVHNYFSYPAAKPASVNPCNFAKYYKIGAFCLKNIPAGCVKLS